MALEERMTERQEIVRFQNVEVHRGSSHDCSLHLPIEARCTGFVEIWVDLVDGPVGVIRI